MSSLRKISEWRMIGALLFVVLVVCVIGLMLYQNLSVISQNVSNSVKVELRTSEVIRQITLQTREAENDVRSYHLTGDNTYLVKFYERMPDLEAQIQNLKGTNPSGDWRKSQIIDSVVILVQDRFELLKQQLYFENEEKIAEELNTLSVKIDEAFEPKEDTVKQTVTISSHSPAVETNDAGTEKKESFFKRLFGRRTKEKEKGVPVQKDVLFQKDTVIVSTVKKPLSDTVRLRLKQSVRSTQIKQIEKLSELKTRELQMEADAKGIMDHLTALVSESETAESSATLEKIRIANNDVDSIKNLALLSSGFISVLLLIIGVLMTNYARKKREYEKALLHAKRQAEDLAKTKEVFLANMSHEIKTPLNAIHGFTEQVLHSSLEESQRQHLNIVKKSADYLTRLVTNILNYSKIEAGKMPVEEVTVDLQQEIREIELLFHPQINSKKVHFSTIVSQKLPKQIRTDLTRLKQILFNVIGNAIKFTEAGQVNVVLEPAEDKHMMRITVTDTGIGVAAEKIPQLFNEYEQAGSSISKKYGGTGLGLVITKKLAEQVGGSIVFRSQEHEGTEVTVTLPYTLPSENEELNVPSKNQEFSEYLNNKHILAVDDEEFNRLLLRSILTKYGVKLDEAVNGAEAVEKTLHVHYDLVIMDIRMPVKNGIEACTEIRKFDRRLPLLASTAVIQEEKIQRCIQAGFTGFIHKPFTEQKLIETIFSVFNDVPLHPQEVPAPGSPHKRINFDDLDKLSHGDKNFEKEMIGIFHKSLNKGLTEMVELCRTRQWRPVADLAHKMMAPCKHFDADNLYELLQYFERFRTTEPVISEMEHKLQELLAEVEGINKELQLYL